MLQEKHQRNLTSKKQMWVLTLHQKYRAWTRMFLNLRKVNQIFKMNPVTEDEFKHLKTNHHQVMTIKKQKKKQLMNQ